MCDSTKTSVQSAKDQGPSLKPQEILLQDKNSILYLFRVFLVSLSRSCRVVHGLRRLYSHSIVCLHFFIIIPSCTCMCTFSRAHFLKKLRELAVKSARLPYGGFSLEREKTAHQLQSSIGQCLCYSKNELPKSFCVCLSKFNFSRII